MSLLITSDIYRKETTTVPSINYHFFQQVQMITSNVFHVVLPLSTFFFLTFHLFRTLKRVQFHFPSVLMPAKKTSVHFMFLQFHGWECFCLHSFKNTGVCTNSYEKNRNDSSKGKKKNDKKQFHHKRTLTCLIESLTQAVAQLGVSVNAIDFIFSLKCHNDRSLYKIHLPQAWHPVVALLFSVFPLDQRPSPAPHIIKKKKRKRKRTKMK